MEKVELKDSQISSTKPARILELRKNKPLRERLYEWIEINTCFEMCFNIHKEVKTDHILGILATIQFRTF